MIPNAAGQVRRYTSVVVEIIGPQAGMPETIKYDVDVNMDNGRIQRFEGIVPCNDRGDVEVRAAKVGTVFDAHQFGDRFYFAIPEKESHGDCE